MDGVQADFFGRWAANHNVTHYKAIPHPVDTINELAHSTPKRVYDFFRNLDPLKDGLLLIDWLHKNNIAFTVLSAPLRGPYASYSIQAKKDWLDQYNPGTSATAIFTSAKFKYAITNGMTNVLVDDFGEYLSKWKNAGGIIVKHEDGNLAYTLTELNNIYFPA